ncbi:jasmonate-induced protein homolog [Silene latifolia]|uniref:jasmonate-induced protein homolog n=1 Tax=Silene latifolia TaxID=37657 RepID=UPI003D77FBF5
MATMQDQNVTVCEKTVKQPQNGTQATMNNQTHFAMTLARSHNWSGAPVGTFPATIFPNNSAIFTHLKGNFFGSKAAVVYNGKNASGTDCSWVLAWHAPADNTSPQTPNRVYVVCGPKQVIANLSFDQIQQKLDTALTFDTSTDVATKTRVDGNISDTVPDIATLIADFKLIP